jgi:hypothetical protein
MRRSEVLALMSLALTCSLVAVGCADDPGPDYQDPRGTAERLKTNWGKSDGTGCAGACGGKAAAGCWCDAKCLQYGDCCADKVEVCDGGAPSCTGFCGGKAQTGCWCDATCADFGDCCPDKKQVCDQPPAPPPQPACPSYQCAGTDCGKLVLMLGSQNPGGGSIDAGYYIATKQKYAYIRKDLAMLLVWAACEVRKKFPQTAPLALSDMTQADGKTPGVDVGQPRHPTTTHTGRDIDVAYYQQDGSNNPQIICGDGSDTNYNGHPGTYNDGYFCTTKQNIVDWPRQVWFLAKLFESGKARVFGIDQMLVEDLGKQLKADHDAGTVSQAIFDAFNQRMAWGNAGGWAFHHHHLHLSFN